jgi:DMSO reductase anchor subunit
MYLGGVASGSSLLAAGAVLTGDRKLARTSRIVALGAITAGALALVADLGRPSRFHHMLRVFRPTSPMNMGSWTLAVYGPLAGLAALAGAVAPDDGTAAVATLAAGVVAPIVGTYTAVLVADTAVPAWHDARHTLPFLFAAGAAGSAGGVACVLLPDSGPARTLAATGALGAVAVAQLQHRRLHPAVAPAYTSGRAHQLSRAANTALMTGAALVAAGRRRPFLTRAGGALIAFGAAVDRFAIAAAGKASSIDPAATIVPQKETTSALAVSRRR